MFDLAEITAQMREWLIGGVGILVIITLFSLVAGWVLYIFKLSESGVGNLLLPNKSAQQMLPTLIMSTIGVFVLGGGAIAGILGMEDSILQQLTWGAPHVTLFL